jgi:diguanylate cyclase (GGDEF)-like protein/PAS domain S-box-containing protein
MSTLPDSRESREMPSGKEGGLPGSAHEAPIVAGGDVSRSSDSTGLEYASAAAPVGDLLRAVRGGMHGVTASRGGVSGANASVGVAVFDGAGNLLEMNPQLARLLGCGDCPPPSLFSSGFVGLEGTTEVLSLFMRIAAGKVPGGMCRKRFCGEGGKTFTARVTLYAEHDISGRVARIVKLVQPEAGEDASVPGADVADKVRAALDLIAYARLNERDLPSLVARFHRILRSLMPFEHCYVALCDGPGGMVSYPYYRDIGVVSRDARAFGDGISEYIYTNGAALVLDAQGIESLERAGRFRLRCARPRHWIGVPLRTHGGEVIGVFAGKSYREGDAYTVEDRLLLELVSGHVAGAIIERRKAFALQESEARFRAIFEHSAAGICLVGRDGLLMDANPAFEELLGLTRAEVVGCRFDAFLPVKAASELDSTCRSSFAEGRDTVSLRLPFLRVDGEQRWGRQIVTAVRDVAGDVAFVLAQVEDITEQQQTEARLTRMAFHDALTGLPNRVLFLDRVETALRRARRHETYHFAVLFLDLDRFKVVNDSLGHKAGDELLRQFARRLEPCLREVDTMARFGGDEFAILLDDMSDVDESVNIIERLQAALRQPFLVQGMEVYTGASIGAVLRARDYTQAEDILRDADIAMYRAKDSGKGRFVVFESSAAPGAQDILRRENELRRALDGDEIELYFQPIVALRTGRITGLEALVRWQHPEQGLLAPGTFIPLAEESNLICDLDMHVFRKGCLAVVALQEAFEGPLAVNINISARSFRRLRMVQDITDILRETGCPPQMVKLEITENLLLTGLEVTDKLWRLKDLGLSLVLDDFGTGYSSLNYLRQFPMDILKIDRSFISRVHEERAARGIVESIANLGRTLGLGVVAEGIEVSEQAEILLEVGCPHGQGYFYSRPQSFDRMLRTLERRRPLPLSAG